MTDGGDPRALVEQAEQAIFRAGHDEDSQPAQVDRGDPPRGARQARAAVEGGHVAHRHAVRLPRPRRDHRRLPARQPDRAGGQAGDGESRAWPRTSPRTPPSTTARPSRCSRSRCPRASSPSASSRRGARSSGESLRKGRVKAEQWPKVLAATEKLTKAPLFIDDSSDLGVLELRAKARRLHQRHPLGLLIIDYLQLMRPEDPRDGRVEQVGKMSRGLKILARELQHPGGRDLAALASGRGAAGQASADGRPEGVRQHRAGRRPRHVRLPRRVLQRRDPRTPASPR